MLQTAFVVADCISQLGCSYQEDWFAQRKILMFSLSGSVLSLLGTSLAPVEWDCAADRLYLFSGFSSIPVRR